MARFSLRSFSVSFARALLPLLAALTPNAAPGPDDMLTSTQVSILAFTCCFPPLLLATFMYSEVYRLFKLPPLHSAVVFALLFLTPATLADIALAVLLVFVAVTIIHLMSNQWAQTLSTLGLPRALSSLPVAWGMCSITFSAAISTATQLKTLVQGEAS